MGVIDEAAQRQGALDLDEGMRGVEDVVRELSAIDTQYGTARAPSEEPLVSRRASGNAGHVPGCARDHALDTACAPADAHEVALRRVEDARAALPEMMRRAYAFDDERIGRVLSTLEAFARMSRGNSPVSDEDRLAASVMRLTAEQIATVVRVVDALAAGLGLEARETLGREAFRVGTDEAEGTALEQYETIAVRLFALGRASVVPPDADLARVIAAWPGVEAGGRADVVRKTETEARWHWRCVAHDLFGGASTVGLDFAREPGVKVIACDVDGEPATVEQWARLRAAGVPVAEGVGV